MEREWAALITLFGFPTFVGSIILIGRFFAKRDEEREKRKSATPPSHH